MADEDQETAKEVVPDGDDDTKPSVKTEDDPKNKSKPKAAAKPRAKRATKPKDDRMKILLEENDDIPPTGLFLGLNGRGYMLKPGEEAMVPPGIVDILEHAIMSAPVVDPQTKQVIGYRDRLKYPFRKL